MLVAGFVAEGFWWSCLLCFFLCLFVVFLVVHVFGSLSALVFCPMRRREVEAHRVSLKGAFTLP